MQTYNYIVLQLYILFNAHPTRPLVHHAVLTVCVSLERDFWHLMLNWYICKGRKNVATPMKNVQHHRSFSDMHRAEPFSVICTVPLSQGTNHDYVT